VRSREKKEAPLEVERAERIEGVRVGRVVSYDGSQVRVQHGREGAAVVARVSAAISSDALAQAAREGQEAVLVFEGGRATKPIVIALLQSSTPMVDAILSGRQMQGEKVARVDGKRVVIEGREEVVLQCGKASLTLYRDGEVVLRGVNVVSQASQVHKIRGGKVQIN
jgi:hypothetical protein